MRWFQLTLVENDPLYYSPSFWLDYFKRTHCEGVCLSGGGCVAYYPTEVPYHHRSRSHSSAWRTRDSLSIPLLPRT